MPGARARAKWTRGRAKLRRWQSGSFAGPCEPSHLCAKLRPESCEDSLSRFSISHCETSQACGPSQRERPQCEFPQRETPHSEASPRDVRVFPLRNFPAAKIAPARIRTHAPPCEVSQGCEDPHCAPSSWEESQRETSHVCEGSHSERSRDPCGNFAQKSPRI